MKPFARISKKELDPVDKAFLLRVMKLDPRDRPTARDLLRDEWLMDNEEQKSQLQGSLPRVHLLLPNNPTIARI
jgi:serine/threonine protein kinase